MPEIVFWNLRGNTLDFPVNQATGVAMISGFTTAILSSLLNGKGELNPYSVMRGALDNSRYDPIAVNYFFN